MKIMVVILAVLLAICIVACAPGASAGVRKDTTVTRVEPVESHSVQPAAQCGWNGEIPCFL